MCKKDYQKQYRENITDEQTQKYKNNRKEYRESMTDEKKQKIKDYQKQYRENMTDEQKKKKIENNIYEERQKYKKAKNKPGRDRYNKMTDEDK